MRKQTAINFNHTTTLITAVVLWIEVDRLDIVPVACNTRLEESEDVTTRTYCIAESLSCKAQYWEWIATKFRSKLLLCTEMDGRWYTFKAIRCERENCIKLAYGMTR